ncbi:LADA_0D03466g1_1 [Lachancea dasiensis]|uniref:LADA_0D03466g1_1 n=1 Tax=Lachancea dasiensis TaxID=1072105 RepID=A0A1G4J4K8_9SACH|nr:LADA_0D03466g1_1 [Lachancea dasiensis]
MPENTILFRARLVQKHGQQESLTFTTAPQVSWTLHKLYPFLLILDGFLNNLMWCCEDVCLPFIYLVLMILAVNLSTTPNWQVGFLATVINTWFGLMSLALLVLSSLYFIVSVLRELRQDEPPTLDDIVVTMENVNYKLDKIRQDVAALFGLQRRNISALILVSTPIHWAVTSYVYSAHRYIQCWVIGLFVFHSSWCQTTMRLIWRSVYARQLWFLVCGRQGFAPYSASSAIGEGRQYKIIKEAVSIPVSRDVARLPDSQLGVQLRLHIKNSGVDESIDPNLKSSESTESAVTVMITGYEIDENQRKWPLDGWTHNLLPYERTKFTLTAGPCWQEWVSPWEFQESLEKSWFWLDDGWTPHEWKYCDANWVGVGSDDSLACYTRSKCWTRRAFRILKKVN